MSEIQRSARLVLRSGGPDPTGEPEWLPLDLGVAKYVEPREMPIDYGDLARGPRRHVKLAHATKIVVHPMAEPVSVYLPAECFRGAQVIVPIEDVLCELGIDDAHVGAPASPNP